jgi:DsbC/DsbD-like thiol-disulfide interchange protein
MSIRFLHRFWLLPALALCLVGPAAGQAPSGDNPLQSLQQQFEADSTLPSSSAELVDVQTVLQRRPVPVGETVRAAVVLDVEDGWHVNARRPTYDYLIGTSLTWTPDPDVTVGDTQYPSGKSLQMDFVDQPIDVYDGQTVLYADVQPRPQATPGERRLTGQLRVQACNDRTCLRPSTVRATLPVPVAEAGAATTPTETAVFADDAPTLTATTVMTVLQNYGALLGGGVLALGTILFLVGYSWIQSASDEVDPA